MLALRILACLLLWFGALPLADRITGELLRSQTPKKDQSDPWDPHGVLSTGLVWLLLQMTLPVLLLALGFFRPVPLLFASSCLLLLGTAAHRADPLLRIRRLLASARPSAAAAAIGLLGLLLGVLLATKPVTDYDTLAYHFPTIEGWVRNGFHSPPPGFENDQIGTYPYGWEALCAPTWFYLSSKSLVLFPNLIALVLLGIATMQMAERSGASKESARIAALLLLSLPLTVAQVDTMHVDLPLAAFFVSGCYYLHRWATTRFPTDLLLASVCVFLLFAIKMSGVPYAALLILTGLVLGRGTQTRRQATSFTPLALGCALLVLAAALFCASWFYLRNWLQHGNPLGHLPVRIGHYELFPGRSELLAFVTKTSLAHLFDWRNLQHYLVLCKVLAFYLGIPLGLLSLFLLRAFLRRDRKPALDFWWRNLMWMVCLALYSMTPYSGDNGSHNWQITTWIGDPLRYGLPAWSMFAVSSATGIPVLSSGRSAWRTLLLTLPLLQVLFRQLATGLLAARSVKIDTGFGIRVLLLCEASSVFLSVAIALWMHRFRRSAAIDRRS